MHTRLADHVFLHRLSAQKLDKLLEGGYFRNANIMFQSQVICLEGDVCDVVNIRLPLLGYQSPKRMERIAAKVEARFRVEVGKAKITEEKEALYLLHRQRFKGFQYRSLSQMLYGDSPVRIFDTREVAVYDGDRLIAFSFFDVGQHSMASILGVFDPEYKKYSLGLYTMYAEIKWALHKRYHYYYPGYILNGIAQFDYKLNLGTHEFYDWRSGTWNTNRPQSTVASTGSRLKDQLGKLAEMLAKANIPFRQMVYPFFSLGYLSVSNFQFYVRGPMHLLLTSLSNDNRFVIVEYDAEEDAYIYGLVRENDVYKEYMQNNMSMHKPRSGNEWATVLEYTTMIKLATAEQILKEVLQFIREE